MVLSKNENGLLPLAFRNNAKTKIRDTKSTLALIGPHLHDRTTTIGNYHGDTTGFGDALEAASNAEVVIFLGDLDLSLGREDQNRQVQE